MSFSSPAHDRIFKGILHVCAAFFLFTVMQALGKLLAGRHGPVEIAFYRNLIALIPCVFYVVYTRRFHLIVPQMPKTVALRALVGTIGLVLTFGAVQALPVANATVLFFTAALMITMLAHFLLKEQIGAYRWAAVIFGFCGVLFVAQPSPAVTAMGIVMALGAAGAQAAVQIMLRAMRGESVFTVTFYFFLVGTILPGIFMPFIAQAPDLQSLGLLLAIGMLGGAAQYLLTKGFQYAPASLLAPFNYTGLIWATGLDILLWQHVPGWNVYAGAAIIIAAQLYILHRERLKSQAAQQAVKTAQAVDGDGAGHAADAEFHDAAIAGEADIMSGARADEGKPHQVQKPDRRHT